MGVLTTIFAWEIFQALATILIFLFLNKMLKKYSKDDDDKKKQVKKGFVILIVFIGLIVIMSGFYTVHSNEKVVLTKFLGERVIDGKVGLHYSLLSSNTPYDMRKTTLDYPTFGQGSETSSLFGEETLITSDGRVVQHSATLFYQINDLEKFALLSKNTETKLYYNLGSSITNEITTNTYETVMQNRRQIEDEVIESLKEFENVYGVEILDFKFLRIMDSQVTVSAKANAEASKLTSQAMIASAESESRAIKLKYNSIEDKDFILELEKLNVLKNRDGDTIWLMDGNTPILTG